MTRKDKLTERLRQRPKDFTWDELVRLLGSLGFESVKGGKTGGSRQRFIHPGSGAVISLHRPHPHKELKSYQLDQVIEVLQEEGFLS
jgi:hypothetical protein